jgi:hypothetical protein
MGWADLQDVAILLRTFVGTMRRISKTCPDSFR